MNYSVTQNGKPLDKKLYTFDESTRTFSSDEDNLVLDFSGIDYCVFTTGSYCVFTTGSYCRFSTGSYCKFTTSSYCVFDIDSGCVFTTGSSCVVVRRDVYEVIELVENQKIKLNGYGIKGFTILDEVISLSGKEVKLTLDGVEYTAVIK